MGLFSKKHCSICNEPVKLLGKTKLADGLLCKDCSRKVSPYWKADRSTTAAQVREHLTYREQNRAALALFVPDVALGGERCVFVDQKLGGFVLCAREDLPNGNPDLFSLASVRSVNHHITEFDKRTTDSDGDDVHDYWEYLFFIDFELEHPFAKTPSLRLATVRNDGRRITEEQARAIAAGEEEVRTGAKALFSGTDTTAVKQYVERYEQLMQVEASMRQIVADAQA